MYEPVPLPGFYGSFTKVKQCEKSETECYEAFVHDRRLEKLLPAGHWPTEIEATNARLFSPIEFQNLKLETRTWVPAMVPWRATESGEVTPAVIEWYKRFAQGEPGAIVVEATGIRDIKSGPLLRASNDRFIEGLSQLVTEVKKASHARTKIFIQLIDFLTIKRRPTKEDFFLRHLKIDSALRQRLNAAYEPDEHSLRRELLSLEDKTLKEILSARDFESYQMGFRERVTDTQEPHIRDLPKHLPHDFAQAAQRCERAGFDGIELHFAHAYTLASFLSAHNTRNDGYGQTKENRVKLPLEVIAAVRAAISETEVLGCRFLADEIIEKGSVASDIDFFAVEFARAGLDFLSLSRGGKFEDARQPKPGQTIYPYTGLSGLECMPVAHSSAFSPWGRNVEATLRIRQAVRGAGYQTPVVVCGGIATFEQAEALLKNEKADVVASARQSLADPDWWQKMRLGHGAHINRCLFTNYCEGLDQAHKAVTCQLWDRKKGFEDDAQVLRTADGRRMSAPQAPLTVALTEREE